VRPGISSPVVHSGDTIRVLVLGDTPGHPDSPLKPGDIGVVLTVDSEHTVHAVWGEGRRWGLIPGLDLWEIVTGGGGSR
jgi:Domain of unknown function (DUF4314)